MSEGLSGAGDPLEPHLRGLVVGRYRQRILERGFCQRCAPELLIGESQKRQCAIVSGHKASGDAQGSDGLIGLLQVVCQFTQRGPSISIARVQGNGSFVFVDGLI